MGRTGWATLVGVATGLVGLVFSALPVSAALEDSIGLGLLFKARGPLGSPDHVVVVSADETASAVMGLPTLVRDWPRTIHAALIDRLVERGASAIAFDLQFLQNREPDGDREFATSLARSDRAILVQRVDRVLIGSHEAWEQQDPIPPLALAAAGLAPAPVPDTSPVSWLWYFLRTPDGREIPTLPAVVLQVHAMPDMDRFIGALARAGIDDLDSLPSTAKAAADPADLLEMMQQLRARLGAPGSTVPRGIARAVAGQRRDADATRTFAALTQLYTGSEVRHLNFYGPPGTICTTWYDVILAGTADAAACRFDNAIVLVGQGVSRIGRAGQADTYPTPYRGANGADLSGVEIQATAVANLYMGTALRSAAPGIGAAVLMLLGGAMAGGGYWMRTRRRKVCSAVVSRVQAAAMVIAIAAVYCSIVYLSFVQYFTLLPFAVVLALQLPTALVLGLVAPVERREEHIQAVCLASDGCGSTALSDRLLHRRYARLMTEYHQALEAAVQRRGGEIVPPEGDGFVAVWRAANPGTHSVDVRTTRMDACLAALEIVEASDRFNQRQPAGEQLPTRVGLSLGVVTVCSDAERGVFRVLGRTVNLANRLCTLNTMVGTRVLADESVVPGLEGSLILRHVPGELSLKGVSRPPVVFEIAGRASRSGDPIRRSGDCPETPGRPGRATAQSQPS